MWQLPNLYPHSNLNWTTTIGTQLDMETIKDLWPIYCKAVDIEPKVGSIVRHTIEPKAM